MKQLCRWSVYTALAAALAVCGNTALAGQQASAVLKDKTPVSGSIQGKSLSVAVHSDGFYSIASSGIPGIVMRSDVEADVDSHALRSSAYPQHNTLQSEFKDEFGSGTKLVVTHTGLSGAPDLVCTLRLYKNQSWGDIEVKVVNSTDRAIHVQAIRSIHATDAPVISLGGPASADRILSDSYSEDRPQLAIRDLGAAPEGIRQVPDDLSSQRATFGL